MAVLDVTDTLENCIERIAITNGDRTVRRR